MFKYILAWVLINLGIAILGLFEKIYTKCLGDIDD